MNRREFIGAGAGAFFVAASQNVLGAGAPSNRVRLVIMGCHEAGRGIWVMRNALRVPGIEFAAVCDVDARARAFAAAELEKTTGRKPKQFSDIRKALEDPEIDGIVCETPDHWHATAAILAMKAGKAVYVEKPCSFCPAEGEAIVRVQKETGRVFQMGNQRRASEVYAAVMREVHSGKYGEFKWAKCWYDARRGAFAKPKASPVPDWLDWDIWQGPAPRTEYRGNYLHYNWHWFRRWGTGEMGNNSPHFLDVARWALKLGFPQRVTAGGGVLFRTEPEWEWPDFHNVTYEFPGGKLVTWECTSSGGLKPHLGYSTGAVLHSEEYAILLAPDDTAALYDRSDKLVREWKNDKSKSQVGSTVSPVNELDTRHMRKFADCIRANDTRTNAPADEAHKTSILAHLGNIALLTGETVRLDPATGALKGRNGAEFWSREYAKGWEI